VTHAELLPRPTTRVVRLLAGTKPTCWCDHATVALRPSRTYVGPAFGMATAPAQ
jgi:hypothetical protein